MGTMPLMQENSGGRQRAPAYRRVLPWIEIALLVAAIPLPWLVEDFWILFATKVLILGLLAISFDMVWGFGGIMSFGQALFFGVAGYTAALIATKLDVTSVLVLLPTAAVTGLLSALVLAIIVILGRRPTTVVFVALGTLTGSYVVERLARGWSYVGGQNGISSLPRLTIGGVEIEEGILFYFMALGILATVYVLVRLLMRSQFGLVLAGIRQQESRIAFLGYRVQNYKGVVFSLGGLIAGTAGGMYAFHEGFMGPGQLGPVLSTQVVLYALFGGVGTLIGPIIGVGLIEIMSYALSQYWETGWPIVLGLLLLALVMFRPTGIMGLLVSDRERVGSFGRPKQAADPVAGTRHEAA
ncbi:MAG: branched-chain amino acid ABC transporter permease [Betaproteobacteria bacterium]|nr:branched-chain amino acid ABC transporter permease [Betaproteobacteria bacterium]